jgi:hypothetical protein
MLFGFIGLGGLGACQRNFGQKMAKKNATERKQSNKSVASPLRALALAFGRPEFHSARLRSRVVPAAFICRPFQCLEHKADVVPTEVLQTNSELR